MHFASNYSAINATSRVSVTVYDASRSSDAFTDVFISSDAQSALSIACLAQDVSSVLTDRKVSLVGYLSLVSGCEARWTVDDPSVDMRAAALTPLTARFQASSTPYELNLLIGASTLPQSASLTFTLACGLAKTSIAIQTNGSPQPGALVLNPADVGKAIETLFSMVAQGWVDSDLPLMYEFGFLSDGNKIPLSVVRNSELSYCVTQLPAGSAAKSFYLVSVLTG